jgi:hypothetical protein
MTRFNCTGLKQAEETQETGEILILGASRAAPFGALMIICLTEEVTTVRCKIILYLQLESDLYSDKCSFPYAIIFRTTRYILFCNTKCIMYM